MLAFVRIAITPALILIFTALYWLHIADAPSAAKRVPSGVIVFILIMTVIVVMRDLQSVKNKKAVNQDGAGPVAAYSLKQWVNTWRLQILFTALSVGYFLAFITIGFNLANFLFLIIALPTAGMGKGLKAGSAITKIVVMAMIVTLVFFVLAMLMDFNVPVGPFGF